MLVSPSDFRVKLESMSSSYSTFLDFICNYEQMSGIFVPDHDAVCFVLVATTSCTFDYDLCGWTNLKNDQFDWSRRTGLTLAPGTGPSADHTSGSKFYFHLKGPFRIYSGL